MLSSTPIRRAHVRSLITPKVHAHSRLKQTRNTTKVGVAATAVSVLTAVAGLNGHVGAASAALPSGAGVVLNAPIVDVASTPDGHGYWEGASDGGIFSFGDAQFYGSTGAIHLNQPIVAMKSTPDGGGYWEVASDGGIFSFGDAQFYGSTGAIHLNQPIVSMESTPDGGGYWEVASDGGVFAFGDAKFQGSASAMTPNSPVVGLASTSDGLGYWETATDGSVFAFGDAKFAGNAPNGQPVVGISAKGTGYRTVASDGGIFTFGGAGFYGSLGGSTVYSPPAPATSHATASTGDGVTDYQRSAWDKVNMCEEGGAWNVEGSEYSGGLGFSHANWNQFNSFGYPADAAGATPDQQIRVAVAFATHYWGNPNAAPDQNGCSGY